MERIRTKLLKSVRGAENHHHPNKAEVDLFRRRRENLVVGICICLLKEYAGPSIISINEAAVMQSAPGLTPTFRIFTKSIILAHNHPGGVAEPSEHDESITAEIQKALALVEISLQDHIILANNEYYSFKRNNLI